MSKWGLYNICLFVQESEDQCSKSYCKIISVGTTGVTEIESFQTLTVFPNPLTGGNMFYMKGFRNNDIGQKALIQVLSAQGKLIFAKEDNLISNLNLDISLSPGVYYIDIRGKHNIYRAMLVKQ